MCARVEPPSIHPSRLPKPPAPTRPGCTATVLPAVDGKRQFSMLGLGDIVIPGIFVAIVLRYDVARRAAAAAGKGSGKAAKATGSTYFYRWVGGWLDGQLLGLLLGVAAWWPGPQSRQQHRMPEPLPCPFPTLPPTHTRLLPSLAHPPVPCSAFGGYVAGLVATIVVMNVFQAAQPALLYIVPGVLGATFLHAGGCTRCTARKAAALVAAACSQPCCAMALACWGATFLRAGAHCLQRLHWLQLLLQHQRPAR